MKAVVQRVGRASVTVDGETVAAIGPGLLVLLGIALGDDEATCDRLADKIVSLRIFDGESGRMDAPLGARELLCVSQFTLYGDVRRGNRPSWSAAAPASEAEPIYDRFCDRLGAKRGVFGAQLSVELVNDGPVTLLVEA